MKKSRLIFLIFFFLMSVLSPTICLSDIIDTEQKVSGSDSTIQDWFGYSLSMTDNYAIVGAPFDDENGTDSGAAYIFERNGDSWVQTAKLTASDGTPLSTVSMTDNYAIVGARESAYIFERSSDSWIQRAKLTASDGAANDYFGAAVSITDNHAIVGAYRDDDNGSDSGSTYIFKRSGDSWVQAAKLMASDGVDGDAFGISVSITDNHAIVGAYGVDVYDGYQY